MKEILLVGNPNAGKTTLFNALTSSDEHVGNWHGVTVENKKKSFSVGENTFVLVDTPGIYSLCPLSFEEQVAVDTILQDSKRKVVNLCDQNNLQRNLFLTLCLLECECDIVLCMNQIDKKSIYKIDCKKLSQKLGISVLPVNAAKKVGIIDLKKSLVDKFDPDFINNENGFHKVKPRHEMPHLTYVKNLKLDEKIIKNFENLIENQKKTQKKAFSLGFLKVKAYEQDKSFFVNQFGLNNNEIEQIFASLPKNSVETLAKLRFDFIDNLLAECAVRTHDVYGKSKMDKILLNKFLAFPIFFFILFGVFYLTFFSLGAALSDCLASLLDCVTSPILSAIKNGIGQGAIYDFFSVAIFGGVGSVLTFLPQVVLLFFFLSLLEDSGYMSRVAFVFEDILGRIGLSGRSVYTLLMGFGCSTTAIMTARNMDDKNAKIKTAILCPYMSCSAKIPIYTVIGGAFFGAGNIFCIVGLYILGMIVSIVISKILDATVLKSKSQSFILEFPPYRSTSLVRVGKILWKNVKEFLVRVGSVMVAMNVIVWVLSSFSFDFSYVASGTKNFVDISNDAGTALSVVAGSAGKCSMLESLGKIFAPIFSPLGFGNWAIVSALLAGIVAKEVVVSSIAMFNGIDAGATKLIASSVLLPTSVVFFKSGASVLAFLVFCLLYTPCIASISMLLQEIGKKWTFIAVIIQLFAAYVVAFIIYNLAFAVEIFGFFAVFMVLLSIFIVIFAFVFIFRKIKNKKICTKCGSCVKCKNKENCGKK